MRKFLVILILLASVFAISTPAKAHPHVFIDARVVLHMKDGNIVAITQYWTFDALFSGLVIQTVDKNRDKAFSSAELRALRADAFNNLKHHNYFTIARLGKEVLKVDKVMRFNASIRDQRLHYSFTVRMPRPLNPKDSKLALLFLDQTYFVAVKLVKARPITFEGAPPKGCKPTIREDTENPIYFGTVVPTMVKFSCATS